MPTLSKGALEREGFQVIERREPSLLAGGSVLITGEVDRTTDFERGMPPAHQAWDGHAWEHLRKSAFWRTRYHLLDLIDVAVNLLN